MNAQLHHANNFTPPRSSARTWNASAAGRTGASPTPGPVWDEAEALAGLDTILDAFVDEVAPDGTQLADERESLLWGFVNNPAHADDAAGPEPSTSSPRS